jgi:hypothetical protein
LQQQQTTQVEESVPPLAFLSIDFTFLRTIRHLTAFGLKSQPMKNYNCVIQLPHVTDLDVIWTFSRIISPAPPVHGTKLPGV